MTDNPKLKEAMLRYSGMHPPTMTRGMNHFGFLASTLQVAVLRRQIDTEELELLAIAAAELVRQYRERGLSDLIDRPSGHSGHTAQGVQIEELRKQLLDALGTTHLSINTTTRCMEKMAELHKFYMQGR